MIRYAIALALAALAALQLYAWDVESQRAECIPGEPRSWIAFFMVLAPFAITVAVVTLPPRMPDD